MVEGLYTAAAGMSAQQQQLDAIAGDLANLSTTGYKAQRVAFGDLLYSTVKVAGTETKSGAGASARLLGGSTAQGTIVDSGRPLDLAIEGPGFFQVTGPNGQPALTRDGAFGVNARGEITDAEGNRLAPPVTLPAGVSPESVTVAPDGAVTAGARRLGQIQLVTVPSPDHLLAAGQSLFTPTAASGAPQAASGAHIRQGALEQSNVDLGREMTTMVQTERDYQLSSSAIQTESQMMSIANQLRA